MCSSKFTKMWSSIKRQKEDDYHYGGERRSSQVLCNSFIPTLLTIYILLARFHVIGVSARDLEYQERTVYLSNLST